MFETRSASGLWVPGEESTAAPAQSETAPPTEEFIQPEAGSEPAAPAPAPVIVTAEPVAQETETESIEEQEPEEDVVELLEGVYFERQSIIHLQYLGCLFSILSCIFMLGKFGKIDQLDPFGPINSPIPVTEKLAGTGSARLQAEQTENRAALLSRFATSRARMHELIRYGSLVVPSGLTVQRFALLRAQGSDARLSLRIQGFSPVADAAQTYLRSLQVMAPGARLEPFAEGARAEAASAFTITAEVEMSSELPQATKGDA
jgi:hypothetical protein